MNCLNLININNKKWEFAYRYDTVFPCRSYLNRLLHWTSLEKQILNGHIEFNRITRLFRLCFNISGKSEEPFGQFFLSLSFLFFLLELIQIIHPPPGSSHINIIGSNATFFVKLQIIELFISNGHWSLECEMNYCD